LKVYVRYLLDNAVYRLLISYDSQGHEVLRNPVQILKVANSKEIIDAKTATLKSLNIALRLVNTAIAQQNLLSGDYLLELMPEALNDKDLAPTALDILKKDSLLYQNWVRYFVISKINNNPNSAWNYGKGVEEYDVDRISRALKPLPNGLSVDLVTEPYKYVTLSFPNAQYKAPLPLLGEIYPEPPPNSQQDPRQPSILKSPQLFYSQEMPALVELKREIVDAIMGYTAFDSLKPDEIALVTRVRSVTLR